MDHGVHAFGVVGILNDKVVLDSLVNHLRVGYGVFFSLEEVVSLNPYIPEAKGQKVVPGKSGVKTLPFTLSPEILPIIYRSGLVHCIVCGSVVVTGIVPEGPSICASKENVVNVLRGLVADVAFLINTKTNPMEVMGCFKSAMVRKPIRNLNLFGQLSFQIHSNSLLVS